MFWKISKPIICVIATLIPLIAGMAVVMAKPAQQTTYPYAFSGTVIDAEHGRAIPGMEVQVACNRKSVSTITKCGQDGRWFASLSLSTTLASCDVEFSPLPNYQAVYAEAVNPPYLITIISPTHIRYDDIPFTSDANYPYSGNNFYINKPMSTTQTPHFSIEWYTDKTDPDYPNDKQGTDGANYINVIASALEDAWPVYASYFKMPPATPGRSDQLITVHVQNVPFRVSYDFALWPDGLSYGGQIWIRNTLAVPDNKLRYVTMHELFHLVQYNYLGYDLDANLDRWAVNAPKLMLRDLWLIESTASWAPGIVDSSLIITHGQGKAINELRTTAYQPLSYAVINKTGRQYGAVVFPLSLIKHQANGQINVIKNMFEEIEQDPDDPFKQIDNLVGLNQTLVDFATANYLYQDAIYGYEQTDWRKWPTPLDEIVTRTHKHTIAVGDTASGSGEVYGLGAEYIEVTNRNGPLNSDVLKAAFRFTKYDGKLPDSRSSVADTLKIRLLLQDFGGNWTVRDVDVPSHLSWVNSLEYEIGGQYNRIVFILMDTWYTRYGLLDNRYADLDTYQRIIFDYTLKLTNTDKNPPLVYACIQEQFPMSATVTAIAADLESGLAGVKFGFSAPTILATPAPTWGDTRFVPVYLLPHWPFAAWDQAGNAAIFKGPLDECNPDPPPGGGPKGGRLDHPDDNASVATSIPQPVTLPEGTSAGVSVGILQRGYASDAQTVVELAGERTWPVSIYFDPAATAQQFPVLVIPSGGLIGLETDATFRARLEEYTRQGGTLVVFSQQHGYEYGALPGGELGGYGWDEDISCFKASLQMETWHPALSGFTRDTLTAHVDGYFTPGSTGQWPQDAQILLSRTANGQPGVLAYPFGAGRVIATTLYDDWGANLGQSSRDAQTLLRDLLTWAILPASPPPGGIEGGQHLPNTQTVLSLPITPVAVNGVALRLVNPARQVALTATLPLSIASGSAANLPFTLTTATPYGLWRVDAQLLALNAAPSGGASLGGFKPVSRFAVARPPALVDPASPLYLSITAPRTHAVYGSVLPFAFHLYNRGSEPLTATVRYGFNHAYLSEYTLLAENVLVPAAQGAVPGSVTLTQTLAVENSFRLRGHAEAGAWQAQGSFGVWRDAPDVRVSLTAQPGIAARGAPVTLTLWVDNRSAAPLTTTLHITTLDGARQVYHTATLTAPLGAGSPDSLLAPEAVLTHTFNVPLSITGGSGQVWVEVRDESDTVIGGGIASLYTPPSPLVFSLLPTPPLVAGSPATFTLAMTNTSNTQAVAQGVLDLTLKAPSASVAATATVPFTLAAGATRTLTASLALPLAEWGRYVLNLNLRDEYGARLQQRFWSTRPDVAIELDQPAYRTSATATATVSFAGSGPFVAPLSVTLSAPALAFSATRAPDVSGTGATAVFTLPLPANTPAGMYPLWVAAAPPVGEVQSRQAGALVVSPAKLEWQLSAVPAMVSAGQSATLTLRNTGGADGGGSVDIRLLDNRGVAVARRNGAATLPAGAEQPFTLTVPVQAQSGAYTLLATASPTSGMAVPAARLLTVDGVSASLDAATDAEWYSFYSEDENPSLPIDLTAQGANGPRALENAGLRLDIVQPVPTPAHWTSVTPDPGECEYTDIAGVALDANGNRWFGAIQGGGEGVSAQLCRLNAAGAWQTYGYDDVNGQFINTVAVDPAGNVWTAFGDGRGYVSEPVGAVMQAGDATQIAYSTRNSGLLSDRVTAIAFDAAGGVWFANATDDEEHPGGVSVLRADQTWITYTLESGLLSAAPTAIAVDAAGGAWVAGDGLSHLPAGETTWLTYTTETAGMLSNDIQSIAVDNGNVWLASGDLWDPEVNGLSCLRPDQSWITYTTANSDISNGNPIELALSDSGVLWIGHSNGQVDTFDPGTNAWQAVVTQTLAPATANALALAPGNGPEALEAWAGTASGALRHAPDSPVTVLWQEQVTLNLAATQGYSHSPYPSPILTHGKYTLRGELRNALGQTLARSLWPFYLYDGALALTAAVTPTVVAPGAPVTVTGAARTLYEMSDSAALSLSIAGVTVEISPAMALPDSGAWIPYTYTFTAPASAGWYRVTADIASEYDTLQVVEQLRVVTPTLAADLSAPAVTGRTPFSVALTLDNAGELDLALLVAGIAATPQAVSLPAGTQRTLLAQQQILTDTTLAVSIAGDVTRVLTRTVAFGEALDAVWSPEARYPAGAVRVPYVFSNTGQLDVTFAAAVTVTRAPGQVAAHDVLTRTVLSGASLSDERVWELPAGDYTLSYATPWQSGAVSFAVRAGEGATLAATAGPVTGSAVTLTAMLTNTGMQPLSGTLAVQAPFAETFTPVSVEAGASLTVPATLALDSAPAGVQPVTLTLQAGNGLPLASAHLSVAVPGAELALTSLPSVTVVAGQWMTLPFGVANYGAAPATAVLSVSVGNLLDGSQTRWLPGGAETELAFGFQAPEGLDGTSLSGEVWLAGQRYDLLLPVAGVSLDVQSAWSQPAYTSGTTATLHFTITNRTLAATPPLELRGVYADQEVTHTFSLAGAATHTWDAALLAGASANPLVFYGVYTTGEQRGVHLNTTYLRVLHPDITVIPDRVVYLPGDTVRATIVTSATTGTLAIVAPGISATLALPATGIQFALPQSLLRGTHLIEYTLDGGITRSVPFDVAAPWVRVTAVRLDAPHYAAGDALRAELKIASTDALTVAAHTWLRYPDGTRTAETVAIVPLMAALNNHLIVSHTLSTAQAGAHQLVYRLSDPDDADVVLAAGTESFVVGAAAFVDFYTAQTVYGDPSAPVTAVAVIAAERAATAALTLTLDGLNPQITPLALVTGTQSFSITWPLPISLGEHTLAARLVADGLAATAQAGFRYGTEAPDLTVSAPRLSADNGSLTRTVSALVYNRGGYPAVTTTVAFWDGAPGIGTLLSEAPLPLLAAGAMTHVTTAWNITGQGGAHTLHVVVDPGEQVAEYVEDNNAASAEVSLPRFALNVATAPFTHTLGQPVTATVTAANLMADAAETLLVTTTFEYVGWLEAARDVQTVTLSAAGVATFPVVWNSTGFTGTYFIRVRGSDAAGDEVVEAYTTLYLEAPPPSPDCIAVGEVLTFTGTITDPGWLDTHSILWDFGDGVTTTEQLTVTHAYAQFGVFTVTLTVGDDDGGVGQSVVTVTVGCGVQASLPEPAGSALSQAQTGETLHTITACGRAAVLPQATKPRRSALR